MIIYISMYVWASITILVVVKTESSRSIPIEMLILIALWPLILPLWLGSSLVFCVSKHLHERAIRMKGEKHAE